MNTQNSSDAFLKVFWGKFIEQHPEFKDMGEVIFVPKQFKPIDPLSGFTPDEYECHHYLQKAYGAFLKMDRQHPDELPD